MTTARIRVPVTKTIVEMVDEMPPADRQAIRTAAAGSIALVEDTPRTGWIPLAVQLDLLKHIEVHLGRDEFDNFCQLHFVRSVDTPLLRTVFDGAVRLFGMGPESVFKVFRRSWSSVSRDAGDVKLIRMDPDDLRIEVAGLPLEETQADLLLGTFATTFTGVFRLFELEGKVELASVDAQRRSALYTGRWTPRR